MNHQTIDLESALRWRDHGALLVDARSPAEFQEASIPGAINVPILDDGERARVGIVHKEEGPAVARRLGVELVSPKLPELVGQVAAARGRNDRAVVVFCWRGGLRSRALAAFLDLAGIPARQLVGGHKAFRAHLRHFYEEGNWGRLLVLRGLTGVGKTRLLQRLAGEGYPVVDLEAIAAHRGSAFGALGLPPQPTQKTFEALLWDQLRRIPADGFALAEGESRNIGKIILPEKVYASLQRETSLWIHASLDYRVRLIRADYPAREELKDAFIQPIQALRRRLGGETVNRLLALLEQGEWDELVRDLMVLYYDPLYNHTRPERRIEVDIEPEPEGLERLRRAIDQVLAVPSC